MPSVEELLNQDSGDEYADISPINDVITIDPETRTIDLPASETLFGTEQEMNVERKYFKCPKIVGDNIDLSKHQIYITYVTAKDNAGTFLPEEELGLYYCEDMNVDETGNYITFSWLLSGNVLSKAGFIAFAVSAKHMDGEVLKTRWKTKPAVGTVLLTVPDGEAIVERYPDIITQLLDRMNAVEEIATELGKNLAKEKMDREQADISLQNDISGKLSEPVEGLAVGKYFMVSQIDENGHAVLEAVDAKTIGVQDVKVNGESIVAGDNGVADLPLATNTKLGLVTSAGSNYGIGISGGLASLNLAAQNEIDARTTRNVISPQNIDYAVKAAMCDGKGEAWTAEEQAAARERMAVENGADFELLVDATLEEEVNVFKVFFPKPVRECMYHIWFFNENGASATVRTKCFDYTDANYLLKYTANIENGRGYAINGYFRYNGPIYTKSIVGYASDSSATSWTTDIPGNGYPAYMNYPTAITLRDVSGLSLELDDKTQVLNVGAKIQVWGR